MTTREQRAEITATSSPSSPSSPSESLRSTHIDADPKTDFTVAFTGGGSAGHVTPNLALIEIWRARGGAAIYLGRAESVESELLASVIGVPFLKIPSERLRRYFHWGNFIMPLIVIWGTLRAAWTLRAHQPRVLFSKGGFVALPVVIGAWLNRIPVVIHESDGSLGLANRLSLPFTRVVCCAQERAKANVKHRDVRVTGAPLRRVFFESSAARAVTRFKLRSELPLLVVFGGSQGARRINEAVWGALDELCARYEILHVVGPDHVNSTLNTVEGYHQYEYIDEGFADLLRSAHLVVGRAGANSVAELIALHRPALLIPLSSQSSRGDQILNAEEFVKLGGGRAIADEALTSTSLLESLIALEGSHDTHRDALRALSINDGSASVLDVLYELGAR